MSLEVTSLGVQVHGGMGFIEETGAAQYYRDAKILTIYEGTTAIQANDLVGRKTSRDGGTTAKAIAAQVEKTEAALRAHGSADAVAVAARLQTAREAFLEVVDFVVATPRPARTPCSGSVPYLMLAGNLMAGWQLGRALLVAQEQIAKGQRCGLHAGQGHHRALLCRSPAGAYRRVARQHPGGCCQRDRATAGYVLNNKRPSGRFF